MWAAFLENLAGEWTSLLAGRNFCVDAREWYNLLFLLFETRFEANKSSSFCIQNSLQSLHAFIASLQTGQSVGFTH